MISGLENFVLAPDRHGWYPADGPFSPAEEAWPAGPDILVERVIANATV
jgi:hypothetical protein